jgi:2-polyprenyl-6-methoxyphenol hydroxylase-like FAD-dependent oxidoreductase
MAKRYGHALVIGGSVAGLMAARMLVDSFEKVTIVERDVLPDGISERSGTPQARHVHNLLRSGLDMMNNMFPGFEDDIAEQGAKLMNWGTQVRMYAGGRWLTPMKTEFATRVASRALIEWALRQRVQQYDGVTFVERTAVRGLVADDSNRRIRGVEVQTRGGSAERYTIAADFVVDASGRGSKAIEWLEALDYDKPPETHVDANVAYSTRFFKRPIHKDYPWLVMYMPAKAPNKRGAGIFQIEGDIWVTSLGGFVGDHPPTDEEGWMEYAKSLPEPDFYEAVKDAEPVEGTGIYGYQRTENYIRHFERMTRFPEGFVLIGDAVCAFNPVYGQGMTSAAMGAKLLGEMLSKTETLDGFGLVFQKRLAKQGQPMWLLATGNDLQFEETRGDRPNAVTRLVQKYVDAYLDAMADDPILKEQFFRVTNLLDMPQSLLRPDFAWRVLFNNRRQSEESTPHSEDGLQIAQ